MSHERIFMNVSRSIESGKITFESAIMNIDLDLRTYTDMRVALKAHVETEGLSEEVLTTAYERIVDLGNQIIECNELRRRLIEAKN